jgi:hypothetical protein
LGQIGNERVEKRGRRLSAVEHINFRDGRLKVVPVRSDNSGSQPLMYSGYGSLLSAETASREPA